MRLGELSGEVHPNHPGLPSWAVRLPDEFGNEIVWPSISYRCSSPFPRYQLRVAFFEAGRSDGGWLLSFGRLDIWI